MTKLQTTVLEQTNPLKPLAGKVAVVTGASRGIGAEIAKALAKNGAQVVGNYLSSTLDMENVMQEIEQEGGSLFAIQADISIEEDSQKLIEEVLNRFGKIDILINNAGVTRDRTFRKMSKQEWDQVININLNSVFNTTSAVINHMLEQKSGRIINISSIIGQAGGFGQTNYSASKAGLLGFTKSLALETARNGITVNAICPGFIETEMVAAMPENVKDAIVAKVPVQRLGRTSEIAEAVLFLAQASYITGQEINVNGGLYM
ncbi:3-oxoacyl-[acyl-carrier-protein] reductase [Psychrobacillus lasiicapitis]|uniref:3-oxoacyl-[acyl-carrier-protein] reductase n=1 Tax=Psychrobacillus lasiicapitis TaxID=1636719 RepID=A0A544T206_9BACI|nr:3-oxoacyl-[acyl-carrier-protein] reductase [Psychrobacillus lasiicapitis]TQR11468.1 3-oxoacyl-[acyl-carrier-protein] reductase [Psychrobacillus lasiicapitis]GGA40282.1 acetoacetyl-CoA reductase [Psychrobacillus lasiicapitis]